MGDSKLKLALKWMDENLGSQHPFKKALLELKSENDSLQAQCVAMRQALEFYATLDWKVNTEVWQMPARRALEDYDKVIQARKRK